MHPVQHFKANFSSDEVVDTTIDSLTDKAVSNIELHDIDSHVRNLCFVWDDGRRVFFNYAYLVSVDLVLTDTFGEMLLDFNGQIVKLKGYQLGILFDLLLNHTPKIIKAGNSRYYSCDRLSQAFVTEIIIKTD